jgi:hypothetical protein
MQVYLLYISRCKWHSAALRNAGNAAVVTRNDGRGRRPVIDCWHASDAAAVVVAYARSRTCAAFVAQGSARERQEDCNALPVHTCMLSLHYEIVEWTLHRQHAICCQDSEVCDAAWSPCCKKEGFGVIICWPSTIRWALTRPAAHVYNRKHARSHSISHTKPDLTLQQQRTWPNKIFCSVTAMGKHTTCAIRTSSRNEHVGLGVPLVIVTKPPSYQR